MGILFSILIVVALIPVLSILGVRLIESSVRRQSPPVIPPAHLANPGPNEQARARARAAAAPRSRLERTAGVGLGLGVMALPWLALWGLIVSGLGKINLTKGRVLRVRNRAQLADLARGDGWTGDPVSLERSFTPQERRALGELWLLTARMEHASVAAFAQLGLHLAALGAPARLVEATHRAALDEIRHARACFAIARAITGELHDAGPIPALATTRVSTIDLTRLAIGSLVDGCLGEGIAADVAAWGAGSASDPAIRDTLQMIARDEASHAELAWDVLAWCVSEGDGSLAGAVHGRVAQLDRELTPRLPDLPGVDDGALARHGILDQAGLGELVGSRILQVQDRARHLLAGSARSLGAAA
jgi:hypothetical protein